MASWERGVGWLEFWRGSGAVALHSDNIQSLFWGVYGRAVSLAAAFPVRGHRDASGTWMLLWGSGKKMVILLTTVVHTL